MARKNAKPDFLPFREVHYPAEKLPCFASEAQWQTYRSYAVGCVRLNPQLLHHPCKDCLPEYQQAMTLAGRCAYPGTEFRVLDGGVQGILNVNIHFNRGDHATAN